jgi:hypothetical protein
MVRNAHTIRKQLTLAALNLQLAKHGQTLSCHDQTSSDLKYTLELGQLLYQSRFKPHAKLNKLLIGLSSNPQLVQYFSDQLPQLYSLAGNQ